MLADTTAMRPLIKKRATLYRAKSASRPVRFWWQAFLLLVIMILLWRQLPLHAVLHEPRIFAPLPAPRFSYVVLSPEEAAEAMIRMRSSWASSAVAGHASIDLDLGMFDSQEERPPVFLKQGTAYPGSWQPSKPLDIAQSWPRIDLQMPIAQPFNTVAPLPPTNDGITWQIGAKLRQANFTFQPPTEKLPELSGECCFEVECDDNGAVVNLLLLSSPSPSTPVFERAIVRGQATCAAIGRLKIFWQQPQNEVEKQRNNHDKK